MIRVRSVEDSTERYLRHSIRAYLTGEPGCDLPWVEGVLRASATPEQARALLMGFTQYAASQRHRDLLDRL
jgi:hypothetical protein